MTYIPRLDGVRALAILAVLLTHCHPVMWRFPGGWVGVDLFFVLSGYLITGNLVREYDSSGQLSLKRFYCRRALRLIPALLVCIALAGVITALGLSDSPNFVAYSKQAALALLYLTNFRWRNSFTCCGRCCCL
jgi:peptidoglycan/LPS O-acetylase OafA/YrhL